MEPAGVGIIGCGIWGSIHARAFSASSHARLVAVCDRDIERARQFQKNYGAQSALSDWNELLADPEISAVSVATPDFAHADIVLAALQAGKHVLVEKPLATTVEECREILSARDKHGVKLMVDFQNRWNIPFYQVRQMVESGEMGELVMSNIRLNDTLFVPTKMLSWADRSSPAHFLGSHLVDLVRWLYGSEVKRVYSVSRSTVLQKIGINTPDFFQSILEMANGGTAVLETCWILSETCQNVYEFKAEFIGTKSSTYVNASHHRMIEKYTESGAALPDVTGAVDIYGIPTGFAIRPVEHFIDCVVHDKNPLANGEDGLAATQVVLAMDESATTGKPVDIV